MSCRKSSLSALTVSLQITSPIAIGRTPPPCYAIAMSQALRSHTGPSPFATIVRSCESGFTSLSVKKKVWKWLGLSPLGPGAVRVGMRYSVLCVVQE